MQTLDDRSFDEVMTEDAEVFTLQKGDWVAVCSLTSYPSQHDITWELRLFVGTPDNELMAASCESHHDVCSLSEKWKTRLLANGWRHSSREHRAESYETAYERHPE